MKYPKITFIGGGNMGRSMLGGLIEKGFPKKYLSLVEPNQQTAVQLQQDFNVQVFDLANQDNLNVDFVILAIKPQILSSVCEQLGKNWSTSKAITISIAAGIKAHTISACLHRYSKTDHTIIRAMPNTPALIGMGATGLYTNAILNSGERQIIEDIFSTIGISVWLENEKQLDTVTALSGSGPAYFFIMIEALIAAGVSEGLSQRQSETLVLQTALGATQMAKQSLVGHSDITIKDLRKRVTSKGGTTAAGLNSLDENNFTQALKIAVQKAKQRSQELAEEFGGA